MTVDQIARKVPRLWAPTTLGEIGRLHCGQSPPASQVNREGRGTPYVTGPEQWDGLKLHLDKWTTQPKRVVPDGCVFITVKGAGVGTIFPGAAGAIGRDVYAFEPSPKVSPRFVEHAVRYTVLDLVQRAVGDIPGLSKNHILDHPIGLPPRSEQDRIVAEIERQVSRLESAGSSLARVASAVGSYRASVLKAACEGWLVPTEADLARAEGREYEPADQLLVRILKERRARWEADQLARRTAQGKSPTRGARSRKYTEPRGPGGQLPDLPEGWSWAALDQLLVGLRNGVSKMPSAAAGVPILRINSVRPLELDLRQVRFLPGNAGDYFGYEIAKDDLLFTRYNGTRDLVGVCAVVGELSHTLIYPDKLIRGRLVEPGVLPRFMAIAVNTGQSRAFVRSRIRTTAGQAGVSGADLRSIPVPLPPLAEQIRIIAEVERRFSIADQAEVVIEVALARADRLRQGILKRAFEGRLVSQDPNDEPASVLLERIRKQREAAAEAKPARPVSRRKPRSRKSRKV